MSAILPGASDEGKPEKPGRSGERAAHRGERRGAIEPQLKGERALVQQHRQAIRPAGASLRRGGE